MQEREASKKKGKAADWSTENGVSVPKEHIWELQKILDGKRGSLRKLYKSQTEGNDESLNLERKTAVEALASLHKRFEQSNKDLFEVGKKFDAESEEMEDLIGKATEAQTLADVVMIAACHTRSSYRRL